MLSYLLGIYTDISPGTVGSYIGEHDTRYRLYWTVISCISDRVVINYTARQRSTQFRNVSSSPYY